MPFKSSLNAKEMRRLYLEGYSSGEIAQKLGFKYSNSVRQVLKRMGCLRSQSEASKLAVKKGKKDKAIKLLIKAAKTFNKNNPAKCPWRGKPELHPRWIKDRNKLKYQRAKTELREWRKAVFKRDNYICQKCGVRGGRLNADHIKPYKWFPALRENIDNGRTLCVDCHKQTSTYGSKVFSYSLILSA